MECDCIKGYTGFVLKKEVVVCGKCGKTAVEASLQKQINDYRDFDKCQEPEWVKDNDKLKQRIKELEAEVEGLREGKFCANCKRVQYPDKCQRCGTKFKESE
jgi:cell division protein FtsB